MVCVIVSVIVRSRVVKVARGVEMEMEMEVKVEIVVFK